MSAWLRGDAGHELVPMPSIFQASVSPAVRGTRLEQVCKDLPGEGTTQAITQPPIVSQAPAVGQAAAGAWGTEDSLSQPMDNEHPVSLCWESDEG